MSSQVASVSIKADDQFKITSGARLIADDLVVTTRHGLWSEKDVIVNFCDYSSGDSNPYDYNGVVLSFEESEIEALKLGIIGIKNPDLCLIRLDKKPEEFPRFSSNYSQFYSGDSVPESLIHLGFKEGRFCVSETATRTVSATEFVQKKLSFLSHQVSWSDYKTYGLVVSELFLENGNRTIRVNSKSQMHEFEISSERAMKCFKNGDLRPVDLKVERQPGKGADYTIVGHKTGDMSSGGSYWAKVGENYVYYGMHIGKMPHSVIAGDLEHHFENHVLVHLHNEYKTPFIFEMLQLETKPLHLVEIKLEDKYIGFLIKQNDKELGYIKDIQLKVGDRDVCYCLQLMDKDGNDCDTKVVKFIDKKRIEVLTNKETKKDVFTENTKLPIKAFTITPKLESAQADKRCIQGENKSALKSKKSGKYLSAQAKLEEKQADKGYIQGVNKSALNYAEKLANSLKNHENYNAIQKFEKAINPENKKKYLITDFSGLSCKKLHDDFDFKGHTQKEENGDLIVKIYATDNIRRIVYDYDKKTKSLTFNMEKSKVAKKKH
jgi:hypothetical protein